MVAIPLTIMRSLRKRAQKEGSERGLRKRGLKRTVTFKVLTAHHLHLAAALTG